MPGTTGIVKMIDAMTQRDTKMLVTMDGESVAVAEIPDARFRASPRLDLNENPTPIGGAASSND